MKEDFTSCLTFDYYYLNQNLYISCKDFTLCISVSELNEELLELELNWRQRNLN
jgi:hypothetical protein